MQSKAKTPEEYIETLPEDRSSAIAAIRKVVNDNLPAGFEEVMDGMIGWVVPHELYPAGYHCDPRQPLPFMGVASQKNYISFYSMCLYSDGKQLAWLQKEWPKHSSKRLDMGKCCVRFKKAADVPLGLIGQLAAKISPAQWIEIYEETMKR
jgi:hypothetical protein